MRETYFERNIRGNGNLDNRRDGTGERGSRSNEVFNGFRQHDQVKSSGFSTNLLKGEELGVAVGQYRHYKEWERKNYRLIVRAADCTAISQKAKVSFKNQILQELGLDPKKYDRIQDPSSEEAGKDKDKEKEKDKDDNLVKDIVGMASAHGIHYRQCALGQNSQVGRFRGKDAEQMLPHSEGYRTSVRLWSTLDPNKQFPQIQLLRNTVIPASAQVPDYGSSNAKELTRMSHRRTLPHNAEFRCHVCRSSLFLPDGEGGQTDDLHFVRSSYIPSRFHSFLPKPQTLCRCFKFEICVCRNGNMYSGCYKLFKMAFKQIEKGLGKLANISPENPDFEKNVVLHFKLKYHREYGRELENYCRGILVQYLFDTKYDPSASLIPESTRAAFSEHHSCQTCEVCVCMEIRSEQSIIASAYRNEGGKVSKKGGGKKNR